MRCGACDNTLEPNEIIWIPERKEHELLCRKCREHVEIEDDMPIYYGIDYAAQDSDYPVFDVPLLYK